MKSKITVIMVAMVTIALLVGCAGSLTKTTLAPKKAVLTDDGLIRDTVLYNAEGILASKIVIKHIIRTRIKGTENIHQWVVGNDDKIYSVGMARTALEFETARKMYLSDAVTLLKQNAPAPDKRDNCHNSTNSVCTGGEMYDCTHTICWRCWLEYGFVNGQYVPHTVCGWQTDDISCNPNGESCER